MSVSLLEVLDNAGYNIDEKDGAEWLISRQNEFDELLERAEATLDVVELDEKIADTIYDIEMAEGDDETVALLKEDLARYEKEREQL